MPSREAIDLAREKLRIPELWRLLNLRGQPGKPGRACHSPFREDRHPSFAIYDGGKTAFDFATGETFDGPKVLAAARGLSTGEALREFVAMAGGHPESCKKVSPPSTAPQRRGELIQQKPDLSKFREPTRAEIHAIAHDRELHPGAPEIARRLGCLKTGS